MRSVGCAVSYFHKAEEMRGKVSRSDVGGDSLRSVDLFISDASELGSLREFLMLAAPDAGVAVSAGAPAPGELGAADVLVLLAGSSGVVTAIRMLPEFLKARRSGISITATVNGKPFTMTATNVDEVTRVLEKILDA